MNSHPRPAARGRYLLTLWIVAGCTSPPGEAGPTGTRQQAVRLATETRQLALPSAADLSLAQGQVVIQGPWGSEPGAFGKRDHASRPGPMSLCVGDDGTIYVLDQVNRRVAVHRPDGQLLRNIPIESEATEEIALGPDGTLWALVYEPGERPGYRITRYLNDEPTEQVPLSRSIELVTGLFVTGDPERPSVWIEQRHDAQTLVVSEGRPLQPVAQTVSHLGRPDLSRLGTRLTATRTGLDQLLVIRVVPQQSTHPELVVTTPLPVVAIQELETDRRGQIFLGLLLGEDAGPQGDHALVNVRKVMLVHRGEDRPPLTVELAHGRATDAFRTVAVSPDGRIYQLHTDEQGATVRRWTLPR